MDGAAESNAKETAENIITNANPEVKTPVAPPPETQPKRSKKDERSRKDDKNVELFMKSLNGVPTLEEKLSLVCKKYVQMADENKTLHFIVKQSEKRFAVLLKEKEQLQLEFNKTILVKSKLENLCRELQKQNKSIKEESLLKIKEEEERRKETQAKFQTTLSEITTLLQQNNDKNAKLREDNISMSEKFKSVLQQYQLREQQVDKMSKQMNLESQLSDAKMQKASLEHQAEKERLLAEMEQLKLETGKCKAKIAELLGTETLLRSQINVYTGKYDEFQNALTKSNQVFVGFKGEMDKMSKKIQKLEKESLSWKRRWESSQASLLQACAEKQAGDERSAAAQRHLDQMQRLCRTLQGERTLLLNTLKDNNIERPPLPPPAPMPPAPPAQSTKMDAMAANCVQLRQSLAELQNQLNVLTTKKDEQKPEKQKKSKSKKKKDNGKTDTPPLPNEAVDADVNRKSDESADASNNQSDKTASDQPIEATNTQLPQPIENKTKEESTEEDLTPELPNLDVKEESELKELTEEDITAELSGLEGGSEKENEKDISDLIEAIQLANVNLTELDDHGGCKEDNAVLDPDLLELSKKCKIEDGKRITKKNIEKIYEASTPTNVSLIEAASNDEISHIVEVKSILDVSSNSESKS